MKKITLVTLGLLVGVVGATTLSITRTHSVAAEVAPSGQALEIAPPVLNLKANPGDTVKATINLRDITANPLVVNGTVDDFTASGEDGVPKIILDGTEPTPYSIKSWVQPLDKLTLQSREIQSLPITINVPKNASPGGYYGVIRFTASAAEIQSSGVSLSASLGALVFLRVSGTAKESLTVDQFYASKEDGGTSNWIFEAQPITFNQKLNNKGNVFEQPTGQITVTDTFGNTVANVNVNLELRSILPATTRKLSQGLDKGNIGDRMLFGLYHAKMKLTYGESKQTVTSELTFWVIPWRLILGIVAAIIVVAFAARTMLRRHTERIALKTRNSRRR